MKGVEVEDMNETRAMTYGASPEEARLMFELDPKRDQQKLVFKAETPEEKAACRQNYLMDFKITIFTDQGHIRKVVVTFQLS